MLELGFWSFSGRCCLELIGLQQKTGREIALSPSLKLILANGLGFRLRFFRLFALRLQLGELLSGKNSLRLLEKFVPVFLGAACFHALGLPGLDLGFLISRKVERG